MARLSTPDRPRSRPWWADLRDEQLLDVKLSKLGLRIQGSPLEAQVVKLEAELERAGLRFRPSVWLSTDWFSPHGVPGFAIPFYLAHPRLTRLERSQMLEAEGAAQGWCMKLLRHETGHAIDTAYRLHRRRSWREAFGRAGAPYRRTYVPRPGSRDFVHNLDNYYAQSHPIEDFAETFAVWLRSRGRWRSLYRGWPALAKLEYVDGLMSGLARERPVVRSRERTESLPSLRITLREYYRRRKAVYGEEDRSVYDHDLQRLFASTTPARGRKRASTFLREQRLNLRRQVSRWTGLRPFAVDEVVRGMIQRSRELGLRVSHSEHETAEGAAVLVASHTARIQQIREREYFR
ncbi:MAG: putative zinc-binding metallopeptidase [Myxococcota bacterium]|nr:putative zinc-binding metallopeptidase [Myxococcota bacterium]